MTATVVGPAIYSHTRSVTHFLCCVHLSVALGSYLFLEPFLGQIKKNPALGCYTNSYIHRIKCVYLFPVVREQQKKRNKNKECCARSASSNECLFDSMLVCFLGIYAIIIIIRAAQHIWYLYDGGGIMRKNNKINTIIIITTTTRATAMPT